MSQVLQFKTLLTTGKDVVETLRLLHAYMEILQTGLAEAIGYKNGRFARDSVICDYLVWQLVNEIHECSSMLKMAYSDENPFAANLNAKKKLVTGKDHDGAEKAQMVNFEKGLQAVFELKQTDDA